MNQIKKKLSIFMASIIVMTGVLSNAAVKAVETVLPTVAYVGVDHSPLVVGDTEKFTVTSNYEGEVQYRAFLFDGKAWSELTKGYGAAVNAKTPYVLPETGAFKLGKQKLSVWVKKAGTTGIKSNSNGSYDSYYVAALNAVSRDDANRVYANGNAKVETNGLTVKFNGIENIGGITGPYLYRLHIYNPATGVWTNRVTEYVGAPSYTFKEAGTYMVVAHAITKNSTLWKNYEAETDKSVKNQGKTYGTYEAWKTVMVTVKANTDTTVKVFDTTVNAATFGSTVKVTLTADGVKNFATATKYQIFDGTKAISSITSLGSATTVFPAKVSGDKVNVKLFDASSVEVKAIEVLLGQSGTIIVKAPVEPSEVEVVATVKTATFGATVNVTSTQEGATKYQVLEGTKAISAITNLGTDTTVFPGKVVGDKVNVKLLDAAGTVVATKEVVLVAAK